MVMHKNNPITITCAVWYDDRYHEIEVILPVSANASANTSTNTSTNTSANTAANTHHTIDEALCALAKQQTELHYDTLIQRSVGIFGIIKNLHDPIQDQDRIEIYEPLRIDPKEARLRRLRKKT